MNPKAAPQISHAEHLDLAQELRAIDAALHVLRTKVSARVPKNHVLARRLRAAEESLSRVKSSLDDHYHSVTTDEEYRQQGHVYYGAPRSCPSSYREDAT